MKINDLKRYKPLDITELSGSPWNNAEKVLGLDENDKVIMAEPDDVVTPEYVADAVNQAMEAETARTEDAYAKKDEIPDMEDYYTKEEVDEAISGITVDLSDYYTKDETDQAISAATQDLASTDYVDDAIAAIPEPDLSDYYTKGETDGAISTALVPYATKGWVESKTYVNGAFVDAKVNEAMQSETARTESTYAKPSDIPSLDGYATEEYVDNAVSSATQDMATEQYVNDAIAAIPVVDLSGYAKTTAVTQDIQTAIATETGRTESVYAKKSEIPSLDNYYNKDQVDAKVSAAEQYADSIVEGLATETYVDDAIAAIPPVDLSDYALISSVTADINTAIANETARTESTYAKPSQIPSLDGYATENWVEEQGYLTEHQDLSAYAKTTAVTEDIQTAMATETGRTEEVYAKKSEIPSLDGYATQAWTTGDTESRIASAMASETARTESTYLKEHQSLDNYYTKSEVDADFVSAATAVGQAIDAAVQGLASEDYVDNAVSGLASEDYVNNAVTAATENLATTQYVDDAIAAIPEPDLSDYYTKSQVDAEITGATEDMATKTWVGQQGYLTQHQDLSAYAKTTAVTEDIASAMASETARTENTYAKPSQIPSLSGYATETYVDTAIASETARTESTYLKEHQDISGKLDKTDFDTYTGATETVLAGKLDATAYTIDNTIDSASTNPVENRAINAALNGVTSSTQMEISSVDSSVQMQYRVYGDSTSSSLNVYLKETNIDGFYAISIKDLVDGVGVSNPYRFRVNYIIYNNNYYRLENTKYIETTDIGEKLFCTTAGGGSMYIENSRLDGTFGYYLVFSTDGYFCSIYKTLPVITEVTDHKANVSDVPTAQDKTNFNQFVYAGEGTKMVVRGVYSNEGQQITSFDRRSCIDMHLQPWGGIGYESSSPLQYPKGNECVDGIKTVRDSQIISRAEEALNGFDENITLTIGNQSSDTIQFNWNNYNLYETDNSRYLVLEVSGIVQSDNYISQVTLSGTNYYVDNPMITRDNYRPVTGSYQLVTTNNDFRFSNLAGNNYIIIDKQLLTLRIADSLTIIRGKQLDGAFVEPKDLTGGTETIIQTLEVGGDSTGTTLTIHLDNGKVVTDYTYPLKETSAGYLLVYDISSYHSPVYSVLSVSDNNTVYYPVTDGDEYVGSPNLVFDLSTIQTGNLKFSYKVHNWLIYNTIDHTLTFALSLPTWSETVQTTGILDDYWTTGETQSAITAATQGMVTSGDVATQIDTAMASETGRTESTYAKPSDIPSLSGYATETWVQNQGYLTQHQDISGKLDKTDFNTYTGATETALVEKLDASAYTVDNAIDSASTNPVENRVVANALDNKAEKTNVDANTDSRYFPLWNSDGAVIGKCGNIVYRVGFSINGWTYNIYREKKNEALPSIYAPQSAGTKGQILVSTGGKPVWSDNNFVTSGDVATQIGTAIESETARTESTYAKPSQIPSLNGYATEQWVQNQGYLTQHQSLAEYYTKTEIDGMIGDIESLLASI